MADNKQRIGWIGMGRMGYPMAERLLKAGHDVSIWNRTPARARELADEFGLKVAEHPSARYDLIVNSTSAGLHAESLPIDWSDSKPETIAYEQAETAARRLIGDDAYRTAWEAGQRLRPEEANAEAE